jgi:hypothetical protein
VTTAVTSLVETDWELAWGVAVPAASEMTVNLRTA